MFHTVSFDREPYDVKHQSFQEVLTAETNRPWKGPEDKGEIIKIMVKDQGECIRHPCHLCTQKSITSNCSIPSPLTVSDAM